MTPFAVSQFTTMPRSAAEDFRTYPQAGVEAIELCESKFPKQPEARGELVESLRQSGLAVISVQAHVHSIFPDRMAPEPSDPGARLEAFKDSMAYWMETLKTPGLPFVLISGVAPGEDLRAGWKIAESWIREASHFAESVGASVAFEPLGPTLMYQDSFIYGLDQGLRLVAAAESLRAGLVIDVWHLWEEYDLARRLEEAAPQVRVVHVCDWPASGPRGLDDRLLPGEGIIRLRDEFLTPLRAGGYKGPLTVEVLSDEALEDSLWKLPAAELLARARKGLRVATAF